MDITIHNLVRGHAREDLKLLGSESILRPRQHKASIISNAGRAGISLVFPLVGHTLLLQVWGNLFNQGSQGGNPRRFSDGSN